MVPGEEHNRTKKKKNQCQQVTWGTKTLLWGCCLAAFWGQFCSRAFKYCPFPYSQMEANSCPPPQVTILTRAPCAPGDRKRGAGVPPSGKQPAARPPLPGAGHGTQTPLLHSPCTAPAVASSFPGLTYCSRCF